MKRLLVLAAGLAVALAVAVTAGAGGVNPAQLQAQGWTCVSHPFAAPRWTRCATPGLGLPFPGNPDPRPSYNYLQFELGSGAFVGTGHLIRQDLYRGQQCGPGGEPYTFLPLAGYYDCVHD